MRHHSRNALAENTGKIGVLLSLAKMVEKIELDKAIDCLSELGIPLSTVLEGQKIAFNWQVKLKT